MGVSGEMDPLDFLTNEDLLLFFRRKKTEISCLEQPHAFLTQLRDHDLLPEKLYKTVKNIRSREQKQKRVYEVLDWLEKEQSQCMHRFWGCVFKDHILQLYPTVQLLRNSLLDGSFKFYEKPAEAEVLTEKQKDEGKQEKKKQRKKAEKRKKDAENSEDSDGSGPSSTPKPTPKKPAKPCFSPLKKGETEEIWKWPIYKTQLPVSCGQKEGFLYRDRLARGMFSTCIFSEERWFTPSGFERFGGKEKSKNWKNSIRCRNTPLKKLIEEGHLQCPPMERRKRTCVLNNTTVQFSASSEESSSADSETSSEMEELRDAEDFEEQEGREGGMEFREEEEQEEEEEMEDLSIFQAPSLPVSCASLTGTLHKYRFASGLRGKCIRTDESWLTPDEFVKQDMTLTDPRWKKNIRCHGKTLYFLLKKEILRIHSLLCECDFCSNEEDELLAQRNDDVCYECDTKGNLVCCDECPRAFHPHCHLPAVEDDSSGSKWSCTFCMMKNIGGSNQTTQQDVLNSPVSQYKLHCQYLLLYLLREVTVDSYTRVLANEYTGGTNDVKLKLQNDDYQTVGEFVTDIEHILQHRTSNRDNDFSRMERLFKREFETIFKIV